MTNLKLSLDILSGSFSDRMRELEDPIAVTATATMDEVVGIVKSSGRQDIAEAGFSKRWQNALRVDRYPRKGRVSMEPAAFIYHNIQYAGVFEEGARILGNPLLWLPLSGTPARIGRNMTTPTRLASLLPERNLVSIESRNGTPLLGATIRLSRSQANKPIPKVSVAALKRGREGSGVLRTIPLFFGVKATSIGRKFSIREICAAAQRRIPALYASNFKG